MESTFCSWQNANHKETGVTEQQISDLMEEALTIAVVGLSPNPHRESHYIAQYLQDAGYRIIPVNPGVKEVLGEKAYPNLQSIPLSVDIVDIFRRPEKAPEAVSDALEISPQAIWLQPGTGDHPELKTKAEAAGILFLQNRCIKVDHQYLIRTKKK